MSAFIFDMDGCLLDSIKIWHEAEQHILDDAGVVLSKAERDELNALTLDEAGLFFHERFGILGDGAEVAQAIIDYMLNFYRTAVEAKPGALDLVSGLHEAGATMCVLSSSPQSFLQAGLGHAGLLSFFRSDLVLSADDLGMAKRDPETFDHMCKLLGTTPSDTWLFDDSWYAVATAQGVGLRTVGVFSSDNCGTHEELGRYCERVIDDFSSVTAADFLR